MQGKRKNRRLPPDPCGPPPDSLISEIAQFSGVDPHLGNSLDPADHIWRGFDGQLFEKKDADGTPLVDKYCNDDRDPQGALKDTIRHVLDSNDRATNQDAREKHSEQAFHALMGLKSKPGPKRGQFGIDRDSLIREAALEFFRRSVDERRGKRDWKSCVAFALGDKAVAKMQVNQEGNTFENLYNELMPEITKDEDRLLFEASAAGLPEWERRGRRIQRVIEDLKKLGIIRR